MTRTSPGKTSTLVGSILVGLFITLAGCVNAQDNDTAKAAASAPDRTLASFDGRDEVVRISVITHEGTPKLQRTFKPLGDYLRQKTGKQVQFTAVPHYAAVIDRLAANTIDVAWVGGFHTSKFIVSAESSVKTLTDLKGKTVALGTRSSMANTLFPQYAQMKAGVDSTRDLSVVFAGTPEAIVTLVVASRADAGAVDTYAWNKLVEAKSPEVAKVRVLTTTPAYYWRKWEMRSDLDPALRGVLEESLGGLDPADPGSQEMIDLLRRASDLTPGLD